MRRRTLLAAAATGLAGLAGCLGGDGDGTPTSAPETDSPTPESTPTFVGSAPPTETERLTQTETETATATVAPGARQVTESLSLAATTLDGQARRPTLDEDRTFGGEDVEEALSEARTAIDELPADRASAAEAYTAVADAVAVGLAAARAYDDTVTALRGVESRHSVRRFGAAADRFDRGAEAASTARTAYDEAVAAADAVPERADAEATGLATLRETLSYLDGGLTGAAALGAGGAAFEEGVEAFALGEERFAAGSYADAAPAYRDAAGSFDDAADGFATETALDEMPDDVAEMLDTHRCRADAYGTAAEGMSAAAEAGTTTDGYDTARQALGESCVSLSWPEPEG